MVRPKSTATAMGAHQALDSAPATNFGGQWWISKLQPATIGIKPRTVVPAVSSTGRRRSRPAVTMASRASRPSFRRCSAQSISTMALLTTMPARLMTPRPVMITPKRIWKASSPHITPIIDRITEKKMMAGSRIELNWITRITRMSPEAMPNAFIRKMPDSRISWVSPVYSMAYPRGSGICAMRAFTSARILSTPRSWLLPVMVTTRFCCLRWMAPRPPAYSSRPREDSGTGAPPATGMNTWSRRFIVSRCPFGRRRVMSYSSSSARNWLLSTP